jgi:hypothetical protein
MDRKVGREVGVQRFNGPNGVDARTRTHLTRGRGKIQFLKRCVPYNLATDRVQPPQQFLVIFNLYKCHHRLDVDWKTE